jgi:hypothetical protein
MTEGEDARGRVAALLEAGLIGDAATLEGARVLEPIPVVDPAGRLHSWFVPVALDAKLTGFAELRPDLELVRYSSFPRPAELADWTDPETIHEHAARTSRPDETLGEPVLTYDREPSRIAWAVTATDRAGRSRTLYVAGGYTYEAPAEPPAPEVGGRPAT